MKYKFNDDQFDPISNEFHHSIPETRINTQQLTRITKPQLIQTTKPQQIQQQHEPVTDATDIGRAMSNGHTHVTGHTIYIWF